MSLSRYIEDTDVGRSRGARSHSAQGLATSVCSPAMKIPLPPKMWITDIEDESSDETNVSVRDEGVVMEKQRVRSRFRHHKSRSQSMPIGIFWDIENCQVPRGCSAIDVVAAIRAKFLSGRREADFVVVCDVRKEAANRLQELNDAQVSLIHVCGTQKNAADEKLRQCMRRFGELHSAPAALLLISGDINFASDLSDFRHRKNMDVILVHKQNTSSALIACASSHYCYNQLTAALPRNPKSLSQSHDDDEEPTCEIEVCNLPLDQSPERVSKRLRRLADNCGGKVLKIHLTTATLKFPTPDHASRALKRMDGEDVFGRKISTRYARNSFAPAYSSDEGYSTAPAAVHPQQPAFPPPAQQVNTDAKPTMGGRGSVANKWAMALRQLPAPTPPPLDFCPPPAPKPRRIRGTHGSVNLDRSGCSSSNSGDDSRQRAVSPWNSSASFSEQSEGEDSAAELTVANLPPHEPQILQDMLAKLFNQYVPVVRVSVWAASEGPLATVVLRCEWDARLCIARIHKRRLIDHMFNGRRLELSLGRPSPAPNLDTLRSRLRAILQDQNHHMLPLLRLRDAYASRHCCALTTSEIAKVKDTVIIHEGVGRMVQLIDLSSVPSYEMEEAPWKCQLHAAMSNGQEDGSRILQPVFMEIAVLERNVKMMLDNHGGILPLLSFVECYEASFAPLGVDQRGVPLEALLRSIPGLEVREVPSRHLAYCAEGAHSPPSHVAQSESSRSSVERERPRTAPVLEPILALFERELVDLLRTTPRTSIPFSKLIPAFHHHFGRQCRVADYGFTKLPDLLAVLTNTIVVLGSGSSRIITLSCAAQARRWTTDLVKVVKAAPGRAVHVNDLPRIYQEVFERPFMPQDYGICTLGELMERVLPNAVSVLPDGTLALPRRMPTADERARTQQFAMQTSELLSYTPNLRMEFSRFVPAYHAHFDRQLRVAHYGCVKLVELFELIPDTVLMCSGAGGERAVKLVPTRARPVIGQRLRALGPVSLVALPAVYAQHYGALPQPDMMDAPTLEQLVYAAGGCVENGTVSAPGTAAARRWVGACLAACAALCDRSVGRDASLEHFAASYRRLTAMAPDITRLAAAGVLIVEGEARVRLTAEWRVVWRAARLLAEAGAPLALMDFYTEYTKRYEPLFPGTNNGVYGVSEYLRQYSEVFTEAEGRFTICEGVVVPRARSTPQSNEDYSLHDTPPGQKGSRVFESPKHNIWCSPPASALPTPCALLSQDKRRVRLAAQFDAAL